MAITAIPLEASLRLVIVTDTSDNGEPIYKVRTYSRLKPEADVQDVHDVGRALADLHEHPLSDIQRVVNSTLSEM